jgi:hypothetical protein
MRPILLTLALAMALGHASCSADDVLIHVKWAGVGQWDPFEREGGFAREFGIEPKFPMCLAPMARAPLRPWAIASRG